LNNCLFWEIIVANLKLTFGDVYTKVSEYLGLGSAPTDSDLVIVKDLTFRGYRKFLMPIDLSNPRNPVTYQWKFLERTTTLSIEADQDTYNLPEDFSSFVASLTYITPISVNPIEKSLSFIYEQKSFNRGTGYPIYYALKTGEFEQISNGKTEIIFWPTPSQSATYYYTYLSVPPKPVEDDDVFVGGDLASEAILESCLAAAESYKYDTPNAQNPKIHATEADRLVQALIGKDKRDRLVPYLGKITDGKVMDYVYSPLVFDQNGAQVLPVS